MARLLFNGLQATLAGSLTSSATTINFTDDLHCDGPGGDVPDITGGDYIPLCILDSTTGALREVVYLTGYGAGDDEGTISRGEEDTGGVTHPAGAIVVCSILIGDLGTGGDPGPEGPEGPPGADGADGTDGTDGADFTERTINTQAASYTAVLGDTTTCIKSTSAAANNVTIPPQSSVTWPTASVLNGVQYGAGQVTIVAGAGVTLHYAQGLKTATQYSVWEARRIASDEWLVYGRLQP